ncbi:MAG: hypothetical protein HOO94_11135 [Novosphingobium sp.]|nr:hypothetical protein [Novosphingobium sp.]
MTLVRLIARRVVDTFRGGLCLWRVAPTIPLLAALPELIQHGLEWRLGMFASRDAFRTLANHPLRWDVGYFKVAAYFLAILLAARFWGRKGKAVQTQVLWQRLGLATVLMVGSALSVWPLQGHIAEAVIEAVGLVSLAICLPLLLVVCGSLFGDTDMTFKRAFLSGWRRIPLMVALTALTVIGGQRIHRVDHLLAFGAPDGAVAALMVWDSFWVGCMACWIGTALAKGYAPLFPKR